MLVETKLGEKEDIKIDGYEVRKMNRDENGGGVMILIRKELDNITIIVREDREVGESMWITIANGRNNIRIGVVYAPQESRTLLAKLKVMYKGIKEQIEEAKKQQQKVLIVGDFNCKIGDAIKGNTEEVTKGGKLLLKMINKLDMKLVNGSSVCRGTWTRVEGNHKSVLDYVIMNNEDLELVEDMLIDEERNITPYHQSDERKIFTDHNAIMLKINWNMRYKRGEHSKISMNKNTKAKFKEKTMKGKLTNIWNKHDAPRDTQTKYTEWNEEVKRIAKETFTVKKVKKHDRKEIRMLKKKKKELKKQVRKATEEEKGILRIRKKLIDQHIEKYDKEVKRLRAITLASEIKKEKGFDGSAFWEYKKRNRGKKAEAMYAMKNEHGTIEENPSKIMDIYQKFYKNLLTEKKMQTEEGRKIEKGVEKYVATLEKTAKKTKITPFTKEEYQKLKKELKAGKAADLQGWKYEMVANAGDDLDDSMLKMLNDVTTNYVVPNQWREMVIKSIGKGKGDPRTMDSKRGLFLTNIVSKVAEKLIKNRNKTTIDSNLTPYQCGGVKNRGIGDNLFLVNSAVEEHRKRKESLYILFTDLEKCFDQLWLKDCIKEIAEAGVPPEEAYFIYLMNKDVKAYVDTPIGRTEAFEVNEIVRQGTVMAVDLCGVSTDKINRIEGARDKDTTVSGVKIKYPVFVDDMVALGDKETIERMEGKLKFLEEAKKFTFNIDKGKSEILVMKMNRGKPTEGPKVRVGKGEIQITNTYKYLGDQYDESGKNKSKIEKKMEKARYIVSEIKRSGSYGEVGEADTEIRIMLLQTVVKPTLLFNTETWINIRKEEWSKISSVHYEVLRKTFEQKHNTPYWGIIAETGIWPYMYEVVYKRLMFFHHLIHSEEKRIARKMVIHQMEKGDENTWYEGVRWWLQMLAMESTKEGVQKITKSRWKNILKFREIISEKE